MLQGPADPKERLFTGKAQVAWKMDRKRPKNEDLPRNFNTPKRFQLLAEKTCSVTWC